MNLAGLAEKEAGNQAFREGDLERALEYYTQAVDANPNEPTYYSNRSAAYHKLGKFQRAIDDAMKCVELRPEWPKGFFRLGEAYHARGLFAKASDAFSTALDLDPTDVGVREALARSQKALYEKTLEESQSVKVPASNLAKYESDEEDQPAVPPPATASYASLRSTEERHREIMNRRLQQSTGICSLEEYMKYRAQGGKKSPTDPLSGGSSGPAQAKAAGAHADFMHSMGIEDKLSASVSSAGQPTGFNSTAGYSSTTSSCKSDLAKQRAEFLASLSRNGAIPPDGSADNTWAKISASDRANVSSGPAASPPPPAVGASSDSSPSSTASNTPLFGRRSATPPQGLPQVEAYAMPPPQRLPEATSFPTVAMQANRNTSKGRGPVAAPNEDEEEVDTISLATVAVMGASVSANHPLFAGLRTKALPDALKADESSIPLKKKYDGMGQGEEISRGWMQEFRAKRETGEIVPPVGDERVVELKQRYGDFHYRHYKETTNDDEATKKLNLANAITAEALAGYEFTQMK